MSADTHRPSAPARSMNLWRLEVLRLLRTRRLAALLGVFAFFGFLGPLTARYLENLLSSLGGDVQVTMPPPTPPDGIAQYMANATQVGLLTVLVVAAGALAFDARPELSAFYRTRVRSMRALMLPRWAVTTVAACVAFVLGSLAAWYETRALLGSLPASAMLAGMALDCLYLAFVVAVVAVATAVTRSVLTAVLVSAVTLLSLPVLAIVEGLGPWLPSHLVGSMHDLVQGGDATDYLRAAAVTVVATVLLLAAATKRLGRREV